MKHGVIFDMDGVLFDTERLYQLCWNAMAEEAGYTVHPDFAKAICGTSGPKVHEVIRQYYPKMDNPSVREECEARVQKLMQNGAPEKPGLHEILEYLQKCG